MSAKSNDNSTASFSSLYEASVKSFSEGQIVKGTIVAINRKEAVVDIEYKSEGLLPLDEFNDPSSVKVGDVVEVLFESLEDEHGMAIISKRKADRQKCWDTLMAGSSEGSVAQGRIARKVRGGFMVDIGMEAFLPASLVDLKPVKNQDQFLGMTSNFVIVKVNHKRKNIVVSRKDFLEREKEELKSRLIKELSIGQRIKGRVKNITDFGAFIDLGGVDGLLHITDLSWGRVAHPSEILSLGDEVEVAVIGIDHQGEKVSLGLKQIQSNPWDLVAEKYPVGSKVKGRVTNILPYGAFVELESGIEGLIHISELSWTKRLSHPSEVLTPGVEVEALVLNVDSEARKISLGVKQMSTSPWETLESRYHVGDAVEGKVRNITDYGVFVELEPGIDGLIHISDMSWLKKVSHPSEFVQKGQSVKTKIMALDPGNQKVSLGMKQLTEDPWPELTKQLVSGRWVDGRITKIVNFGIFVELEGGLEGLVHISEIPQEQAHHLIQSFHIGDAIQVQTLSVDNESRRIALSLKGARPQS